MLLKESLTNEKSFHTLPLWSVPFHISPSLSLPLQTLRFDALVSLIIKTKRIAERSDTNCDTHTQSHTDRQSTLAKYMVNWAIGHRISNYGKIVRPYDQAHFLALCSKFCKVIHY